MMPHIRIDPNHVKTKLAPVIEALKAIDGEAVCYDPDMFETCAGLLLWAEGTVSAIDAPKAEPEIEQETEESVIGELVARVSLRTLTLQMLIEAENRIGQCVIDQFERDLAEAKFMGTAVAEVKKMEADAESRAEAHRLNIIDLQNRHDALKAFLASSPNYEFSLLSGSEFDLGGE